MKNDAEGVKWKRLRTEMLLERPPWLRVYADDVELPDGRRIDGFLRVDSRDYATIFCVTEDQQAVFIRQYKYGPNQVALQLPAGYLEEGESAEQGARRELLEETGYEAEHWEPLGTYVVDGNRVFGRANYFLATGARRVQEPNSGDLEEAEINLIPLADVPAALTGGEMIEVSPVACVALALARLGQFPRSKIGM